MKTVLGAAAWTVTGAVALWAVLNPKGGVVFQGPGAWLGVGLIGLGLCLNAKRRRAPAAQRAD